MTSHVLDAGRPRAARWRAFVAVLGPGLVVMLADTDVGSIITAGQSGVQWGYRLLLLQFMLMPILYVVQELTVRLGIFTGKGHGELIREVFGKRWAWVSVAGLGVTTAGALLTEFSGVAGVGELFGVPRAASLVLAAGFLLAVVWTGSYRRVERVAIALGLFEFAFFWVAYASHPQGSELADGLMHMPLENKDYLYLVAANIGAVIMPWMIFYQQSAVADKKLRPEHYRDARWDTAIGAVITQLVMAAILVAAAATIGKTNSEASLNTIGDIAKALTPFLGPEIGRLVFGLGTIGAAMVAAIVVSLASAWGVRRGRRLQALARAPPVGGALVLRRLHRRRGRRRYRRGARAESRHAQHRRRGHERADAAAGARTSGPLGHARAPRRAPPARPLPLGRDYRLVAHRRPRRLWRHLRRGAVLRLFSLQDLP